MAKKWTGWYIRCWTLANWAQRHVDHFWGSTPTCWAGTVDREPQANIRSSFGYGGGQTAMKRGGMMRLHRHSPCWVTCIPYNSMHLACERILRDSLSAESLLTLQLILWDIRVASWGLRSMWLVGNRVPCCCQAMGDFLCWNVFGGHLARLSHSISTSHWIRKSASGCTRSLWIRIQEAMFQAPSCIEIGPCSPARNCSYSFCMIIQCLEAMAIAPAISLVIIEKLACTIMLNTWNWCCIEFRGTNRDFQISYFPR